MASSSSATAQRQAASSFEAAGRGASPRRRRSAATVVAVVCGAAASPTRGRPRWARAAPTRCCSPRTTRSRATSPTASPRAVVAAQKVTGAPCVFFSAIGDGQGPGARASRRASASAWRRTARRSPSRAGAWSPRGRCSRARRSRRSRSPARAGAGVAAAQAVPAGRARRGRDRAGRGAGGRPRNARRATHVPAPARRRAARST